MVTVRLFAAAAEAAGCDELELDLAALSAQDKDLTVADVRFALGERFGEDFERVLRQCTIVVNDERTGGTTVVTANAKIDVLPPFAGG